MDSNLISIVIPVYNVELYIKRCLDSVLNQSYKNIEIILVDDGSVDNSGKICDEYAKNDNRIKVVHKENGGVSSARNVGLNIAKGDYIGFIDPDDYISIDMYEILMSEMCSSDYNVVECNYCMVYEDGKERVRAGNNKIYTCYQDILHDLFTTDVSHGIWNKLYKREVIGEIRFNHQLAIAEDSLFLYEVAKNMRLKCIDKPLYYYFQRTTSVLNRNFHKGFLDKLKVSEMIRKECNSEKLLGAFNSYYLPNLISIFQKMAVDDNFSKYRSELRGKIVNNKKYIFQFKPYKVNGGFRSISKKNKVYVLLLWLCPGVLYLYLRIRKWLKWFSMASI